jgi:Ca2+-binding RTX toxin-like protein
MRARIILVLALLVVVFPMRTASAAVCDMTSFDSAIYISGSSASEVMEVRHNTVDDTYECRIAVTGGFTALSDAGITRIDIGLGAGVDELRLGDDSFPTEDLTVPVHAIAQDNNDDLIFDMSNSGVQHDLTIVGSTVASFGTFHVTHGGFDFVSIVLGNNQDTADVTFPLGVDSIRIDGGEGTAEDDLSVNGTGSDDRLAADTDTVRWNGAQFVGHDRMDAFIIRGADGNDRIEGSDLPEEFAGGQGRDRLLGGGGRDFLGGDGGRDTCIGGPGRDEFQSCETKVQ